MPVIAGDNKIPYRWFVKWVGTYSPRERKVRIARIVWSRKNGPGVLGGWTSKLSINLVPRLFRFSRDQFDTYITICGIQLHKQTSFGGWIS